MLPNSSSSIRWDDLPSFCNASEVAALLRVSRATAYRMATTGQLPSMRLGKRIIFSREHLKAWIDKSQRGESKNGSTHER